MCRLARSVPSHLGHQPVLASQIPTQRPLAGGPRGVLAAAEPSGPRHQADAAGDPQHVHLHRHLDPLHRSPLPVFPVGFEPTSSALSRRRDTASLREHETSRAGRSRTCLTSRIRRVPRRSASARCHRQYSMRGSNPPVQLERLPTSPEVEWSIERVRKESNPPRVFWRHAASPDALTRVSSGRGGRPHKQDSVRDHHFSAAPTSPSSPRSPAPGYLACTLRGVTILRPCGRFSSPFSGSVLTFLQSLAASSGGPGRSPRPRSLSARPRQRTRPGVVRDTGPLAFGSRDGSVSSDDERPPLGAVRPDSAAAVAHHTLNNVVARRL